MKFFPSFALIVASLLAHSQIKDKPWGQIKGSVTDANGNPVRGVTVYAVPQDISLDNITPQSTTTNGATEFDFRGGFELGTYKLYSKKDFRGLSGQL